MSTAITVDACGRCKVAGGGRRVSSEVTTGEIFGVLGPGSTQPASSDDRLGILPAFRLPVTRAW
jgi:hypothetical protein